MELASGLPSGILQVVYMVVVILFLFGLTIFIHELGHYLVARWCGLVVKVFSIGFGPAIVKKTVNGILYKIAWIPCGGYVALPQMDPTPVETGAEASPAQDDAAEPTEPLPYVKPWKKILVAFAGATGNIILAYALAWGIYIHGKPAEPRETTSEIGYVTTNSAAYAQGMRIGHVIRRVGEQPINNWLDFLQEAALYDRLEVVVERPGGETYTATLETERDQLGIRHAPGLAARSYCRVGKVEKDWSADAAGVKAGDHIESFDGVELKSTTHMTEVVAARIDQTVPMVVLRGGEAITLQVTPRLDPERDRARIGIHFSFIPMKGDALSHPKPMEQMRSHAMMIVRVLRALMTPKTAKNASQALGGPVLIFQAFWWNLTAGLIMALYFTCLLNVNLAVINLLPLPVLDGGHIVFALWEWVTGRPVHPRVVTFLVNLFAILLISVFLLLTLRDIRRARDMHVMGKEAEAAAEARTNGPPATTVTNGAE